MCGIGMRPGVTGAGGDSPLDDPLLTTPAARLCAVALQAGIQVFDVPADACPGLAGTVGATSGSGLLGLADDLDDDLRADVLAFGIAVLAAAPSAVSSAPEGYLAIGRTRLPAARGGVGHLAWHMARTCGRDTPSATFELAAL
ncbi:hypothetical protein BAY60_20870 [Prauserella muralis]|uniref:Uncharacterized protein n=1 Tax=Prauserella muralis TaxID=588067 RepID=A0A2V4ANP8_9PSEU|nr:hypothetical protein BAY60_20870 [Prauserella muralis]